MIHLDGGRLVIRCNHCKQPIHAQYRNQHLLDCRDYQRHLTLNRIAFAKCGQKLYAIAIQRNVRGDWRSETHYVHAADRQSARNRFLWGERDHSRIAILDCGLVVGMFVNDRDGHQLSTD